MEACGSEPFSQGTTVGDNYEHISRPGSYHAPRYRSIHQAGTTEDGSGHTARQTR